MTVAVGLHCAWSFLHCARFSMLEWARAFHLFTFYVCGPSLFYGLLRPGFPLWREKLPVSFSASAVDTVSQVGTNFALSEQPTALQAVPLFHTCASSTGMTRKENKWESSVSPITLHKLPPQSHTRTFR